MAGLPNAVDGFMRGYEFVDRMENRELQRERLQQQDQRQAQRFEMEQDRFDLQKGEYQRKREKSEREERMAKTQRELAATITELRSGNYDPERVRSRLEDLSEQGVPLKSLVQPESREAVTRASEQLANGAIGSEEFVQNLSVAYQDRLNKGVGQPVPKKYGEGVIRRKRISRIVPGKDRDGDGQPDKVAVELAVDYERPDGSTGTYRAPLTAGRSTDDADEEVKQVAVEDWVRDLAGRRQLAQALEQDPQTREQLEGLLQAEYVRAGGNPSAFQQETRADWGYSDGVMYNKATGEARALPGGVGGSGRAPAQVQTVEWIARNLTDGDKEAAWKLAQQSKSNPQELAMRLFLAEKKAATENMEDVSDEEIMARVQGAIRTLQQSPDLNPLAESPQPQGRGLPGGGDQGGAGAQQGAEAPPPQVLQQLREGVQTKFANGQVWTVRDGQPVRIQ